jgi:hypothetical protein
MVCFGPFQRAETLIEGKTNAACNRFAATRERRTNPESNLSELLGRKSHGILLRHFRRFEQGRGAALPRKRDTDLLSETQIVARLMEIGMADATLEDFHDDVVWA